MVVNDLPEVEDEATDEMNTRHDADVSHRNKRPLRSLSELVASMSFMLSHSAIRRRSSEQFGKFIEFLG